MFARKQRLDTRAFESLMLNSKTLHGSCLYIRYKRNNLPHPRFVVVVPKKTEKNAVKRNFLKRMLRKEIIKTQKTSHGFDIAFFIKKTDKECLVLDVKSVLSKI